MIHMSGLLPKLYSGSGEDSRHVHEANIVRLAILGFIATGKRLPSVMFQFADPCTVPLAEVAFHSWRTSACTSWLPA